MKPKSHLLMILGVSILLGLTGCMPKPEARQEIRVDESPRLQQADSMSGPRPQFGSFNLQKRHGLGGWSRESGPSEQELLRTMNTSSTPTQASDTH